MKRCIRIFVVLLLIPFTNCNTQEIRHNYDFVGKSGSHGPPWMLVEKRGKVGFVDENWNLIVPVEYDSIRPFEAITYQTRSGVRNGIGYSTRVRITVNGKTIVPAGPDYKEVTDYHYAVVIKGKKYGAIDTTGKLILPVIYDSIGYPGGFSQHSSIIMKDGKRGAISLTGELLVSPDYDDIKITGSFGAASAIVVKNGKQGVVNSSGQEIIDPEFEKIDKPGSAGGSLSMVKADGKYGVVSSSGHIMIHTEYDSIGHFSHYLPKRPDTESKTKGSDEGPVTKTIKIPYVRITWTYTPSGQYSYSDSDLSPENTIAMVKKGNKYGYISISGKVVVPVTYSVPSEIDLESYLNRLNKSKL